ncbi:phasin family protein [Dokdonella soli]|uniref:Poly granule associated protein n=1 Tax=Dokdonella soli TaxID=529810 RepID=A0ABN1ICI1_9GAMM
MAKPKLKTRSKTQEAAHEARGVSKTVMDSAQQIWLAGLGAFAKAQAEGGKLFEALVKEGAALDAKTRKFTEAKVNEARGNVESTLGQVRERSQETWDKLEKVFEDRVSRALGRLGIPGHEELKALTKRVEELSREVRKLSDKPAAAKRPAAKRAAK